MHASFCITAYIHVHAHPHADDFIGATSVSVKALIAAYEARTDKSSPVVDFYRVVLKSANGKDVSVKFDKTADLRESVADMTRAVNHIRGKHRLELSTKFLIRRTLINSCIIILRLSQRIGWLFAREQRCGVVAVMGSRQSKRSAKARQTRPLRAPAEL